MNVARPDDPTEGGSHGDEMVFVHSPECFRNLNKEKNLALQKDLNLHPLGYRATTVMPGML